MFFSLPIARQPGARIRPAIVHIAMEPKIGHAKSENRMDRCYLNGLFGDALSALLAAAGGVAANGSVLAGGD